MITLPSSAVSSVSPCHPTRRRSAVSRRLLSGWIPLATVLLIVPAASADDHEDDGPRNYFEFQSGVSHVPNQTLDGNTGQGSVQPDEAGFIVGGAFGRHFTDMLRGELAITYRQGDLDQAGFTSGTQADGKTSLLAVMLNVYADFPLGPVTPWVGFGIGGGSYKIDVYQQTAGAFDVDDEDAVFVYNAMVGAAVPVTEVVTFNVGYRYIAIGGDQDTGALVGGTPSQLDSEFDAHEAMLGVRFAF